MPHQFECELIAASTAKMDSLATSLHDSCQQAKFQEQYNSLGLPVMEVPEHLLFLIAMTQDQELLWRVVVLD